ncbi:hypothetical protein [Roseomonas sp. WA12]
MRPTLACCLTLVALTPVPTGGASAQGPDGYHDPVAAARNASLHLHFEVTGPLVPDAGDRCAIPAVARRVFRADRETADRPPQPIDPVTAGTALTLVVPCLNTAMPFNPVQTTGPLADRARIWDPPFDGTRRLRLAVPRERQVPQPGDVLEAFLTPSRAPNLPCGHPRSVEQGRWVVPRPLTATPVVRRDGTSQVSDPPGARVLWMSPPPCSPGAGQR